MPELQIPALLLIGVAAAIGVAILVFWVWMLIDCLKRDRFSSQDRLIWVIVIVLLKILGAAIYYFMEYRPHRT